MMCLHWKNTATDDKPLYTILYSSWSDFNQHDDGVVFDGVMVG
jgi:hypothetical protein